MTISEILNDIQELRDNYSAKKELNTKYGTSFGKKDDFEQYLYSLANDIRKKKTSDFNTEDLKVYYHSGAKFGTKLGALKSIKNELPEFIEFVLEDINRRQKRCGMSMLGKSLLREIANIEDALNTIKNADKIRENENKKSLLFDKLNVLTMDYRKQLIETMRKNNENTFARYSSITNEKSLNRVEKVRYNTLKVYTDNFTNPEKWLDREDEGNNRLFDSNLQVLAQRLLHAGLDASSDFEISNITNDPKFIQCVVKTSEGNFYCRSIIAAEYSSYMRAHWRFIVTKRK